MAHQLHVLQTLMLNVMDDKMNRAIDPQDADAQEKVRELRRIAFDGNDGGAVDVAKDVTTRQHNNKISPRDFRKLGFKNDTTPLNDFGNMIFYSINNEENNNNNKLQLKFHPVLWRWMLCSILLDITRRNILGLSWRTLDGVTSTTALLLELQSSSQNYYAKFSK